MNDENVRSVTVAFRVEVELAELLDRLPNKSDFIRKAIAAQLGICCPLCKGKGHIPRALHDHFARLIAANRNFPCDGCGGNLLVPDDHGELAPADRARLEQFFSGGPFYCDSCYETAPPCGACGWHVDDDHLRDHMQKVHAKGKHS